MCRRWVGILNLTFNVFQDLAILPPYRKRIKSFYPPSPHAPSKNVNIWSAVFSRSHLQECSGPIHTTVFMENETIIYYTKYISYNQYLVWLKTDIVFLLPLIFLIAFWLKCLLWTILLKLNGYLQHFSGACTATCCIESARKKFQVAPCDFKKIFVTCSINKFCWNTFL